MHIILGGNGHVGSAVAQTLLSQGEPVTIVSRSSASIPEWQKRGAMVEVVDAHNTVELRWDFSLQSAKQDGVIHTFFPTDFALPMVAPRDIKHTEKYTLLNSRRFLNFDWSNL